MSDPCAIRRELPDGSPDAFAFDDYREFFRAWDRWRGQELARRGRRYASSMLYRGAVSASHWCNVVSRAEPRYTFNAEHVRALAVRARQDEPRIRYLELLAQRESAKDQATREALLGQMMLLPGYRDARPVTAAAFFSLSTLLHMTLYELARRPDFAEDLDWIRGALTFPCGEQEIRQAMEDLIHSGALLREESGRLVPNPSPVRMQGEGHRDLFHRVHEDLLDQVSRMAGRSPERCRGAHQVLLIPNSCWEGLIVRLQEFEARLVSRLRSLGSLATPKTVYQFTWQILPAGPLP